MSHGGLQIQGPMRVRLLRTLTLTPMLRSSVWKSRCIHRRNGLKAVLPSQGNLFFRNCNEFIFIYLFF